MTDYRDAFALVLEEMLRAHCSTERVTQFDGSWDSELWKRLDEAGYASIGIPEHAGGSGGTLGDAALTVKISAHSAAPIPLAQTVIAAAWLRARVGLHGSTSRSTVIGEPGSFHAVAESKGWRITGTASVPWGRAVDRALVTAESVEGLLVADIDCGRAIIEHGTNRAGEPFDRLSWSDVAVAANRASICDRDVLDEITDRWALVSALRMAGAMERVLDMTCEFATQRAQFGVPIVSFQAVKQQLALLAAEVTVAAAAADAAVAAAESGDANFRFAATAARVRTASAASRAIAIAHQIHGAMGTTRDCPLHLFTRRLSVWRDEYGAETTAQLALGRTIAATDPAQVWQTIMGDIA